MKKIVFKKADPAACPSYRNYYIQDRLAGKDIYGNTAYEYALFIKSSWTLMMSARKRRKAYQYLADQTGISKWDLIYKSSRVICNNYDILGIQSGDGTLWRMMKRSNPVQVWTRPQSDVQLSGWKMTYWECLEDAKILIESLGDKDE